MCEPWLSFRPQRTIKEFCLTFVSDVFFLVIFPGIADPRKNKKSSLIYFIQKSTPTNHPHPHSTSTHPIKYAKQKHPLAVIYTEGKRTKETHKSSSRSISASFLTPLLAFSES